ncbi:MAG TPA: hypothetical protein VFL59_08235 [Candidatus Nanopelagicales bacterium]|nr:hypothetical protein [Candidatus Nanopelagicales bacterium]
MGPTRRAVGALALGGALLLLAGCGISTSDKPATSDFNPLGPGPSASGTGPVTPTGPDLQLRPVLSAERADAGQCPRTDPPTPPKTEAATLCTADLTTLLTLGPAIVDGANARSIDAGTIDGANVVRVELDTTGGTALSNETLRLAQEQSPKNWLAVVSHGRVQTAPAVTDQISGGILDISGFATADEARSAAALFGG